MKFLKRSLLVLCLLFVGFLAASCDSPFGPKENPDDPDQPVVNEELDDYKELMLDDLRYVLKGIEGQVSAAVLNRCKNQELAGEDAIKAAKSFKAVKNAFNAAKKAIANCIPLANGIYTFAGLSQDEKTEILGILEAYAVRNGITGISLFENGSYVMYSDRVTLGTEVYIVGYGFGVLAEGSVNGELEYEDNPAWKSYYHTFNVADPGTANYLNDQGSEVGDFYGYFGASFVTTFMNETKDGYDWIPELAKEKPQPVGELDENGQATKFRMEIRVGEELKYNTNSQIPSRQAFNGREVQAEDYLTPFKLLLTQANHLYRGSELANKPSAPIVGAKDYYDATASSADDGDFSTVGVKVYEEEGKTYFEVEFATPLTPYYAMYYITSSLYMPIPQEFIDLVTVENYLGYNADKTETPVDNSLSLGAYTLEAWNASQEVVYKKNPYYVYADTKYATQGIHIKIMPGAAEDPNLGIKEFLAGHIDAAGIPKDYLNEYKSDPRTRQTKGDSNFKLNVNACSPETWEKLFGENGSVLKTAKEDYWEVEPALSNPHFVRALSYSIDRLTFAAARGSVPSVDYLSSAYMSDGENGVSYSGTQEHAKAVERLLENTSYGYNIQLARDYFRIALLELEAEGLYTRGTAEKPTVISLEIAWMYPTHEEQYHKEIKQYLETAFNDPYVSDGCYKLEVEFWVGNAWSDVYYGKLMTGQYDLGFGSISGNTLNPLDFVSVLSSDQDISGNFTLNWGTDTNDPNADILVYQGKRWSYDALWTCANGTGAVNRGANQKAFNFDSKVEKNADGSATVTVNAKPAMGCSLADIALVWYGYTPEGDYNEYELPEGQYTIAEQDGKYVFTVKLTAEDIAWIDLENSYGLDVYATVTEFGTAGQWGYYKSVGFDLQ